MSDLCQDRCTCNGFRAPELCCPAYRKKYFTPELPSNTAVDVHGPLPLHPDLDPTRPLPWELTQSRVLADVEKAKRATAEIVLCCERGDLHRVDVSGVRRIFMHPDDFEDLARTPGMLLLVSSTMPPGLFAITGIDIMKSSMMPRGMMAFDPPARRLEGK